MEAVEEGIELSNFLRVNENIVIAEYLTEQEILQSVTNWGNEGTTVGDEDDNEVIVKILHKKKCYQNLIQYERGCRWKKYYRCVSAFTKVG